MKVTEDGNDVLLSGVELEDIAAALIMLVPGCLTLGHAVLTSTLDYVHPEPGSAADFVKDMFTLPPGELARKWYGDETYAMGMHAFAMSLALFGPEQAGSPA